MSSSSAAVSPANVTPTSSAGPSAPPSWPKKPASTTSGSPNTTSCPTASARPPSHSLRTCSAGRRGSGSGPPSASSRPRTPSRSPNSGRCSTLFPGQALEVFGTGLDRYETGFEETLDVIFRAATGRANANGGHFTFREVPLVPTPERRPDVVVACGGRSPTPCAKPPRETFRCCTGCTPMTSPARMAERRARRAPGGVRLCAIHPVGDPALCVRTLETSLRRTGVSHVLMLVEASVRRRALPALRVSSPAVPGSG